MNIDITRTEKNKMKEDIVNSLEKYLKMTYKEVERNKEIYLNLEKFLEEVKRAIKEKFIVRVSELVDISSMDISKYKDEMESDLLKLNSFKKADYKTYNDYPYFSLMLDNTKQIYSKYNNYSDYGMFLSIFRKLESICYRYKLNVNTSEFYERYFPSLDDIIYKDEEGNLWYGVSIGFRGLQDEVGVIRNNEIKQIKFNEYENIDFTEFLVEKYGDRILRVNKK